MFIVKRQLKENMNKKENLGDGTLEIPRKMQLCYIPTNLFTLRHVKGFHVLLSMLYLAFIISSINSECGLRKTPKLQCLLATLIIK